MGILAETTHPTLETYPRLAPTVRFSRSATRAGPAPLCGADTDRVLGELGYSAERIEELRKDGTIGGS
jgi:crotonobetainyl-CoA:carnitine CoA-transferase CaiB-like acyl-CoA transferase